MKTLQTQDLETECQLLDLADAGKYVTFFSLSFLTNILICFLKDV